MISLSLTSLTSNLFNEIRIDLNKGCNVVKLRLSAYKSGGNLTETLYLPSSLEELYLDFITLVVILEVVSKVLIVKFAYFVGIKKEGNNILKEFKLSMKYYDTNQRFRNRSSFAYSFFF